MSFVPNSAPVVNVAPATVQVGVKVPDYNLKFDNVIIKKEPIAARNRFKADSLYWLTLADIALAVVGMAVYNKFFAGDHIRTTVKLDTAGVALKLAYNQKLGLLDNQEVSRASERKVGTDIGRARLPIGVGFATIPLNIGSRTIKLAPNQIVKIDPDTVIAIRQQKMQRKS